MSDETEVRENEEGFRSLDASVADVDDTSHEVTVDFPHEVLDGYRTDWGKGCWSESLAKRLPPMVFNHNPDLIIGTGARSESLGDRTRLVGKFADFDAVPKSREAFALIRDGIIPGFSFHYRNARSIAHPNVRGARRFVKADMMEFGPVTFPAIPGAEAVGLRGLIAEPLTALVQAGTPVIPLETILKLGENGHLTDEGVRALIEEHYPQLAERIIVRTPEPTPEERIRSLVAEHDASLLEHLRAMTINVDPGTGATSTSTDGDEDEDPPTLIRGIDACLDAASAALGDTDRSTLPDEVQQALALMDAAGVAVDELQDVLGIDDPDDPPDAGDGDRAQMSTKDANDLEDSDFAYVESGGTKDGSGKTVPRSKRHFPIHDEAHVRNALSRIGQGADFGKEALPKVKAAAKKMGIDVNSEVADKAKSGGSGSRSLEADVDRTLERLNRRAG